MVNNDSHWLGTNGVDDEDLWLRNMFTFVRPLIRSCANRPLVLNQKNTIQPDGNALGVEILDWASCT
jgi:hypothetical protein